MPETYVQDYCPRLYFFHPVAQKRYAPVEWHFSPLNVILGGSQTVCTVGMAPLSSKFCPRVAQKRYALFE